MPSPNEEPAQSHHGTKEAAARTEDGLFSPASQLGTPVSGRQVDDPDAGNDHEKWWAQRRLEVGHTHT
jgi:hypothetical protein